MPQLLGAHAQTNVRRFCALNPPPRPLWGLARSRIRRKCGSEAGLFGQRDTRTPLESSSVWDFPAVPHAPPGLYGRPLVPCVAPCPWGPTVGPWLKTPPRLRREVGSQSRPISASRNPDAPSIRHLPPSNGPDRRPPGPDGRPRDPRRGQGPRGPTVPASRPARAQRRLGTAPRNRGVWASSGPTPRRNRLGDRPAAPPATPGGRAGPQDTPGGAWARPG